MSDLKRIKLIEISVEELEVIVGGSFWKDLGYGIGYCAGQVSAAFSAIAARPQDDIHS